MDCNGCNFADVVEHLIKDGKEIDAVSFIQEYELAEKFPPVPLLKTYLKSIRKGHTGLSTAAEKNELHMKELDAARAILKCLQKYKLEDFPVEGLQKRIVQLENLSSDKKRTSDANTNTNTAKRARANGPGGSFRASDRFGGRGMGGHNYGSQYGRGSRGGYPYPGGVPSFPSSYSHGNYHYGGGPPSYQGPYLR
ncbi:hypothetical protein GOP47_0007095 [Adiantum capillus-veneris]|uniref:FRIGIDA-like protein n=1 Tax=Adiantum capillus-veneris TaxID=13818 RepID=A0A9D4V0L7_ADICA|nr:hypothetical protein GOP47_0007095 [Adiantum capillus-veneris]